MKRMKKEISLLLVIALVVSSLVIGLGTLQANAVSQASGQLTSYRYEVATAGQDCNGTGTANNCVVTIFFTDSTSWSNTIAGESSPNYFEAGATDNIYFSSVPAKPISSIQIDSQGGDRWKESSANFYYSPDGGTTWWRIATMGGFDGTGVRGFTYPAEYSLNTTSLNKTLTFDANGGTGGTQIYSEQGATLPSSNIPTVTRTGYTFAGWSPSVPATGPGADTTYTAQWSPIIYFIAFNGNGATSGSMETITCLYGTSPTIGPNSFSRLGYTFNNWNTAANGSGTSYAGGASLSNLTATNGATVTLYAQWSSITYYIAFNGNGNTGGSTATQTFTYGTAQALNYNGFSRTGYSFGGWSTTPGGALSYTDNQSVVNLTATNGETVTLYAKWTPYTYTIVFDGNGATGGSMPSINCTVGVSVVLPPNEFYKIGNSFTGWGTSAHGVVEYLDGDIFIDSSIVNGGTIVLYAQWTPQQCVISFSGNGATSGSMSSIICHYGDIITLPPNAFARTGYYYLGWATSPTGPVVYTGSMSYYVTGSATLYAKWNANTYTITYNGNSSTGGSTNNSVHTYNVAKNLTANGYIKTGYTFLGWAQTPWATTPTWTDQQSVLNLTSINGATVTLYAIWQANYYNITFDANGGTGGTGPTSMMYGSALTAPTVTRTGYDFAGWSPVLPTTVPAAEATYTAQWSIHTVTVTFDPGGTFVIHYGDPWPPTFPPPTRTGYTFTGWSPAIPPMPPFVNTTYTAKWILSAPSLVTAGEATTVIDDTNHIIYGLAEGITQEDFESIFVGITGNGRLQITPYDEFGQFGTGTKVELIDNATDEVVGSYYIVIFGDINGDGVVSAVDGDIAYTYDNWLIEWNIETQLYLFVAGDINGDGIVSAVDGDIMYTCDNWLMYIDQTTGLAYAY